MANTISRAKERFNIFVIGKVRVADSTYYKVISKQTVNPHQYGSRNRGDGGKDKIGNNSSQYLVTVKKLPQYDG